MAQCLLVTTPNMNRAAVKARISPPSKAVHEKLIRQCMQRMKSQRRQAIEASRVRGLGLQAEHQMFRGLLYEQLQQQHQQQREETKGDEEAQELRFVAQEEVAVEEEQLDEDDELLHALGKDNYDEFMIWLEQGLRAELEVMERQQAEEDEDGEFDELERLEEEELNAASQLVEIAQDEFILCPQCKEHPLKSLAHVYSCECGLQLPSVDLSVEDLRHVLRSVLDAHRQCCAADVIFQQHKDMLYAYCWECGLVEPVCPTLPQQQL